GRERLARTGLPVPGEKAPPAKTAREAPPATQPQPPRETEPARPSRSALVTLRLTTRPPGALVRNREGAIVGKTPLALSLKPGSTQRLTLSTASYAPRTRTG